MKKYLIPAATVLVAIIAAILLHKPLLLLLAAVSFVQNMAFTASSRSRNSGNPGYHFWIATVSNGVWFLTNFFFILPNVQSAPWYEKLIIMAVYIMSTSYGSVVMMEIMLKKETGKNKVGATV